jgi:EAL domain-containing protein (putative c-di-GMP-specific phosphodiesterase class I)
MFEAKARGGGHAHFRAHGIDSRERLALGADLRAALAGAGGLSVVYQPIYRLGDRRLMGVEALARWSHPQLGAVPPDVFIPIAEACGAIGDLGDWVFGESCRQLAAWGALGLRPNAGINVSPQQLARPGLAARSLALAEHHAVDPRRIVVELTESAWTVDAARSLPALSDLRAAGFGLALDDFGAGYSSLSRLRALPVDVIKVDRGFMHGIPEDPHAAAILDAIFALADACDCDVVSEGLETPAQLEHVITRGCALGQGFGLGRPQSPQAVTALLQEDLVRERRAGPAA